MGWDGVGWDVGMVCKSDKFTEACYSQRDVCSPTDDWNARVLTTDKSISLGFHRLHAAAGGRMAGSTNPVIVSRIGRCKNDEHSSANPVSKWNLARFWILVRA